MHEVFDAAMKAIYDRLGETGASLAQDKADSSPAATEAWTVPRGGPVCPADGHVTGATFAMRSEKPCQS